MTGTVLSFFMNMLMAGLLLATILYCLKLNKRISLLQDSKSELAQIIHEFDASTKRATQNINEIHAATTRLSENIQHKIDKANYLADDLEMLIERAGKATGRVEAAPPPRHTPRAAESPQAPPRSLADSIPARSPEASAAAQAAEAQGRRPLRMRSRAEQELMNLIGKKSGEGNR